MYNIGIDLGGTNIATGLVDENGKIISKHSLPTDSKRNFDEITADMHHCGGAMHIKCTRSKFVPIQ